MARNVTQKLIASHLVSGEMTPGAEIAIRIDQTLTQDATGTLVMLELEAMELDRVHTEVSVQYVDHNLLQTDHRNADDHLFLLSGCRRFGIWFSRPGNGVSHPVHQERFGKPGRTLLGADSHTCAAGAIGMLAIGAGGLQVALAMTGEPFHLFMPQVWGIRLEGKLPPWCSAKDVILEMLRRHGVDGGIGRIVEYHGPGVRELDAMDRHVLANMGAELGATTTVFPADEVIARYLERQGRAGDHAELLPDPGATYDAEDTIDLSKLEPLIAKPTSPGNVVPVREVAGAPITQAYVGSSANPGFRDIAIVAGIVKGRQAAPGVSLDINPASRQVLLELMASGHLQALVQAGARLHQTGCNGCIGMGQAPATGRISLRTVPRNFPGRSGTREDPVYLCSPETAAVSALTGRITDPRTLGASPPTVATPPKVHVGSENLLPPLPPDQAAQVQLEKGPNIHSLPALDPFPDELEAAILLKVGDDLSTDEILPAGSRVLPFRSNIEKIAEFAFDMVDPGYPRRARELGRPHAVIGGQNYGQGSSREHAALAPRFLGLHLVLVRSFARIHRQNLVNFGVLPLTFHDVADYDRLAAGDRLRITGVRAQLTSGRDLEVLDLARNRPLSVRHDLTEREVGILLAGGLVNVMRRKLARRSAPGGGGARTTESGDGI